MKKHRVTVIVEHKSSRAEISATVNHEDDLWNDGQIVLHQALDAVYGPALVAEAVAAEHSGARF